MKRLVFLSFRQFVLASLLCILTKHSFAQYYYHDILLTAENMQQLQLYKKNAVAQIKLLSFEANGQPAEKFTCEVTPNTSYSQIKTITQSDFTGNSSLTAFYHPNGQLYRTMDSSTESINQYQYSYDNQDRLISATSTSAGLTSNTKQVETHVWTYRIDGCPDKMLRIKNNMDTSTVRFKCDTMGNVTEEELWIRGIPQGKLYYYYDTLHRLTDIVRYHPRLSRLLPDYMFEYDDKNQVTQMTTLQQGGTDYLLWEYRYNDNGLKTQALCRNKQKQPAGKIEYLYHYR